MKKKVLQSLQEVVLRLILKISGAVYEHLQHYLGLHLHSTCKSFTKNRSENDKIRSPYLEQQKPEWLSVATAHNAVINIYSEWLVKLFKFIFPKHSFAMKTHEGILQKEKHSLICVIFWPRFAKYRLVVIHHSDFTQKTCAYLIVIQTRLKNDFEAIQKWFKKSRGLSLKCVSYLLDI